jgi:hypothetical protein
MVDFGTVSNIFVTVSRSSSNVHPRGLIFSIDLTMSIVRLVFRVQAVPSSSDSNASRTDYLALGMSSVATSTYLIASPFAIFVLLWPNKAETPAFALAFQRRVGTWLTSNAVPRRSVWTPTRLSLIITTPAIRHMLFTCLLRSPALAGLAASAFDCYFLNFSFFFSLTITGSSAVFGVPITIWRSGWASAFARISSIVPISSPRQTSVTMRRTIRSRTIFSLR